MSQTTRKGVKCVVCDAFENCYDSIQGTLILKDEFKHLEDKEVSMDKVEFKAFEGQEEKKPEFISVDIEMPDESVKMGFVCTEECEEKFNRNPMEYEEKMTTLFPAEDGDFVMFGGK